MHAIGAPETTAAFELQVNPEGQEINPEVEVQQAGHEEPEEEIECPNHEPASFVKGKPRSILSLPLYFFWEKRPWGRSPRYNFINKKETSIRVWKERKQNSLKNYTATKQQAYLNKPNRLGTK